MQNGKADVKGEKVWWCFLRFSEYSVKTHMLCMQILFKTFNDLPLAIYLKKQEFCKA
jgi:hypothetical protein